jgi:hypothetical protein
MRGGLVGCGLGWICCYRLATACQRLSVVRLDFLSFSSLSQRLSRFDLCAEFTFVAVLFVGE